MKVNIAIMRAFVKLRETPGTNRELAKKFSELEQRVGKHDREIAAIIDAIRQLIGRRRKPHARNRISRARDAAALRDAQTPMIAWTIYLTFAGALLALLLPRMLARWIALATTSRRIRPRPGRASSRTMPDFAHLTTIVRVPWVPALGMNYHLAADGISLTMTLVTGLTAICAVLFSWKVEEPA